MSNIWEFFYQTLSVSLAAAVLLAVKWLLRDKLSPRWQYAVWGVLALRALIPASLGRSLVPQLALWTETAKSAAELALDSAFTGPFELMSITAPVPLADGLPRSLTDWLFVLYAAGVLAALVWYAYRYARLRALLWRGREDAAVRAAVDAAAEKYGLKPCRAVSVPGLKGAFVCGVIRPVLAVPEGEIPDGKVILHELLHLKYLDAAQNIFWCVLRALHWCNPFLQYVFNRVGNDMEALCDRRVLERLEGEERREYGSILLGMASDSYARAPGTSSISNGARNIARRIEAIARFKLYPRGMALVSVCTVLILASALLTGVKAEPMAVVEPLNRADILTAMAAARLERCQTIPSAIECYVKGEVLGNSYALAACSAPDEQEAVYRRYEQQLESGRLSNTNIGYEQYLLSPYTDGEGVFHTVAAIDAVSIVYSSGVDEDLRWEASRHNEDYCLIPVEVRYLDGAYTASGGELGWADEEELFLRFVRPSLPFRSASVETPAGTLTAEIRSCGLVESADGVEDMGPAGMILGYDSGRAWSQQVGFDTIWSPYKFYTYFRIALDASELVENGSASYVSFRYEWLPDGTGAEEFFAEDVDVSGVGGGGWSDSTGAGGLEQSYLSALEQSGGMLVGEAMTNWNQELGPNDAPYYPKAVAVTVYIDGEPVGDYVLELRSLS